MSPVAEKSNRDGWDAPRRVPRRGLGGSRRHRVIAGALLVTMATSCSGTDQRPPGGTSTVTGSPDSTATTALTAAPDVADAADGSTPDRPACPPTQPITSASTLPPVGTTADPTAPAAPRSGPYPVASPLDERPLADATRLQEVLDTTLPKLGNNPGAMALVWVPGQGVWRGTAGLSNPATNQPMDPSYFFHIGSATKPFTGVVALRLVDQGKLGLDDPVGRWFPSMPDGDQVTVRQLANMTSGINSYSSESQPFFDAMAREPGRAELTMDQLVAWGLELPRKAPPGQEFFYSNTATVMLALIAEKVEGKPYPQVLDEQVLRPLGLSNTAFPAVDDNSMPQPAIHGFFCDDGNVIDVTDWNTSWASAAGAMTSTLDDMAVWTYQLGTGALVKPETFAAQTTFVPIGGTYGYGPGLADFGGWWGHNGGMPGYTTYAVYNPAKNVVLVLNVNSNFDVPTADGKVETPATILFRAFDAAITSTPPA